MPDLKIYPLWMSCRRCFRLVQAEGQEWCTLCLRKLALVAEYDQMEASEHHLAAVSDWRHL